VNTSPASPTGIAPVLQLHPTRRCNLACAHCYTSSGPAVQEELNAELLLAALDDAWALGYRQLAVSGGEPLLYARLPEVLQRARALGMLTTVTSNGMLATAKRWRALAPLVDVLAVSIDGTPSEHDAIRRRAGAFARTVANFATLRASHVTFGIIFTLTQHNVDSLEFVVRLAAEHGARSVQVHPLTLSGRAATDMATARPDAIELGAALFAAAQLAAQLGVAVHVDALTGDQLAAYREHFVPTLPVRRLTDVAPVLVVQADGVVVPLTHDVHPALHLGSLAERRLQALAAAWIERGGADELARACERAWREVVALGPEVALYWYDEVAARTRDTRPLVDARCRESPTAGRRRGTGALAASELGVAVGPAVFDRRVE
jgi:Fe-coproporphyrin III synthase